MARKFNTSTSDNRLFIYDAAGKLIEERATTGVTAVQKSYVYAGSRMLSVENEKTGDISYLTADMLGTPRINTVYLCAFCLLSNYVHLLIKRDIGVLVPVSFTIT